MFGKVFKGIVVSSLVVTSATYPVYTAQANDNSNDGVEVDLGSLSKHIDYTTSDAIYFNNGEMLKQSVVGNDLVFTTVDAKGNEEYRVKRIDDMTVEITNLETGKKTYKTKQQKEVALENLPENIQNQVYTGIQSRTDVSTQSNFVYDRTVQTDTSIQAGSATLAAGILASFLGVAVGVVTAIATYYYSINQPHAYWYEVYSKRYVTSVQDEVKQQNVFYKTHLYQNYVDTVTKYYMDYHNRN